MQLENKTHYHQRIHDLPLDRFIECLVDGNLARLIISGIPSEEQLSTAWELILGEYSELIGNQEFRMYKELFREVSILKITLDQITISLSVLQVIYDPFLAAEVNKLLNTNCKFDWADQNAYQAECINCLNRSKSYKMRYDLKIIQFEAIQKKNQDKPGTKMDRQYFTSILITLSDHAKYRIEETIKMSEYCERIKRFSDYCEQLKNRK